jgi:hypothetical protein
MTATELLNQARGLGLQLESRDGGGLAVRPASKLPPDLAANLRHHKAEVLGLLASQIVASAMMPSPMVPSPMVPARKPLPALKF